MMQMEYETAYSIYDHFKPDDPNVPWPILAVSPKESVSMVDPMDFRLDQFAENRVHEIFGLSFDEVIHYPRRDYLKVIESAKKHSAKYLSGMGALGKQLTSMEKQMQVLNQKAR